MDFHSAVKLTFLIYLVVGVTCLVFGLRYLFGRPKRRWDRLIGAALILFTIALTYVVY